MNAPATKADLLDADITRLFEKQGRCASPQDIDLRILDAAEVAVKRVSKGSYQTPAEFSHSKSWWLIGTIFVLSLALLYPVVQRFLDLPNAVQDSSRVISKDAAVPRLEVLTPADSPN